MDGDEWPEKAIAEGLEQGGAAKYRLFDAALAARALLPLNRMLILRLHFGRKDEIFGERMDFLVRTTYRFIFRLALNRNDLS